MQAWNDFYPSFSCIRQCLYILLKTAQRRNRRQLESLISQDTVVCSRSGIAEGSQGIQSLWSNMRKCREDAFRCKKDETIRKKTRSEMKQKKGRWEFERQTNNREWRIQAKRNKWLLNRKQLGKAEWDVRKRIKARKRLARQWEAKRGGTNRGEASKHWVEMRSRRRD